MSHRRLVRLVTVVCALGFTLIPAASALADPNAGDVWVDNVGQPAGPGHEMDPHLACQNIDLWGSGLADASGSYTIDGWPPSGSQEQDYASNWSYDQAVGGSQVIDVISVTTLIDNAVANGDAPQNGQGFHFKLEFSSDPQKHKTFWVDCQIPTISTVAASATAGQPIHDVATLTGGATPTGTITWNVYSSTDTTCSNSLGTVTDAVSGDGTYTSPDFMPPSAGSYQWVATYSGDAGNVTASNMCNDPNEQSVVSKASPSLLTTAASNVTVGQPIDDSAVLSGGDVPIGTITWSVYVAGTDCAAPLLTTAPVTVDGDGTYTSPSFTPAAAGTYQWVATYSGDANNSSFTSPCDDTSEQSIVQTPPPPPPVPPAPGISVVKLQRDGATGPYTTNTITARVGDTIDYEIVATNTGNTPLTLSLSDPRCDAGTITGPFVLSGTLTGDVLSPGGVAQYTCSHLLAAGDPSPFTNTATVTGQPPSGPPVEGTASVSANKQAVAPVNVLRCGPHKVKKHKKVRGKTVTVCVAKKRVSPVVRKKRIRPPNFTG